MGLKPAISGFCNQRSNPRSHHASSAGRELVYVYYASINKTQLIVPNTLFVNIAPPEITKPSLGCPDYGIGMQMLCLSIHMYNTYFTSIIAPSVIILVSVTTRQNLQFVCTHSTVLFLDCIAHSVDCAAP